MRKTYGNTWWGKEWLNALSEIDYSNRLPRGRTYANKGAAENIEIHKNVITAEVKGSQYRPYKVKFTVPKFDGATKAAIISLITENPLHLSKLLNRQLPAELNKACQGKDIYIFPHSWNDLEGSCSCPDWAVPCKHMAAVLYLVANEIDKNPFLVFQLHDFDLFKGLEGIGYSFESDQEVPILSVDSEWEQFSYEKELLEWKPDVFEQLDFSSLPFCKDN